MPRYYPAFLDLRGKLAVVVGGGEVAVRKVELLLSCGARVRLVSPGATESPSRLGPSVERVSRPYRPTDLDGAFVVFAATDDPAVNGEVASEARARGILVNVADAPPLCDFLVPSVVSRGDLQIAISTGGASPALARHLREELERAIGPEYAELVALLEAVRERVLAEIADPDRRRAVFDRLVRSDLLALIRNGDRSAIQARVESIVRE
jgi:precorrin-2 dehydrogenase/sirohydrochlorin ferrochelatase